MKEAVVTTESLLEIMNHQLEVIDEKDKKLQIYNKNLITCSTWILGLVP